MLLTLVALGFVLVGLYIMKRGFLYFEPFAILGIIVGAVSTIYFGACFLYALSRLLSKKPGLIISDKGFEDYSSFLGGYKIKWEEIDGIDHLQVQKQKFIRIMLKEPEILIARTKGLQRFVMRMNYKFFGSPIHISANSLTYDFAELKRTLVDTWHSSKL